MQGNIINLGGGDDLFFYKSQNNSNTYCLSHSIAKRRPPWGYGKWWNEGGSKIKAIYSYGSYDVDTTGLIFRDTLIIWSDGTLSQLVEDFTDITAITASLLAIKREMFEIESPRPVGGTQPSKGKFAAALIAASSDFGVGATASLVVPNSYKKSNTLPKGFDREFVSSTIDDALIRLQKE